jgi:type IV pilus assembly protein PilO
VNSAISAFRDRKVLFAILLAVIAGNVALLVSYRTFYDVRLQALVAEEASLEARRDEARRRADEAVGAERKLFETQETLTTFFSETLGKRQERIAPLIEEIYQATRTAGLRPDVISYSSADEPGTDALTMGFTVTGPYGDVKRLLASLERSKRFLVVEQLALSEGSEDLPGSVSVSLTVTNYFQPGTLRPIRRVVDPKRPPAARPGANGAKGRPVR